MLMCKPATDAQCQSFDESLRGAWQKVLNVELTPPVWKRAELPLKMGGLATGTVTSRAASAFLCSWTRTQAEVLRRVGLQTVGALMQADDVLGAQIQEARRVAITMGAPEAKLPFAPDGPAPRPTRQKAFVEAISEDTRNGWLREDSAWTNTQKAQLRSVSGPGAAGFLLLPTQPDHHVEDNLFRAAVVRRLGGTVVPREGQNATCELVSREGRCTVPLDGAAVHANQCKCGGLVMRRHDRVVKWLAEWLGDGRVESDVLVEQVVASENIPDGRLDVTFEQEGRRVWLDVAVVATRTANEREIRRRAKNDGSAARDEEVSKKSRYRGLATPFVIEAYGRPGQCARGIIGKYCQDRGSGDSADAAAAWQTLSAIIQAGSSDLELRACGWAPANRGEATFTYNGA